MTIAGSLASPGAPVPELRCRCCWLSRDDAMVLVADSADEHADVGFDNLMMMVLRADLRDPLRRVGQALPHGGVTSAMRMRWTGAVRPGRRATQVLDRLIDPASVEGSESLAANDRIELWPLLQQAWARVEPLARARNLKGASAQGPKSQLAAIYGSEPGCCACSSNAWRRPSAPRAAGRHARHQHRQMGRARWSLRDSGVSSARAPEPRRWKAARRARTPARGAARLARAT